MSALILVTVFAAHAVDAARLGEPARGQRGGAGVE
jgi:hypothetical protein